jgi:sec-independent protein translocase protein TatA
MTPLVLGLGVPELLIILAVVLLLFGGARLAGLGKSTGRALREFKEETKGLKSDDSEQQPPANPAPGAAAPTPTGYQQPPQTNTSTPPQANASTPPQANASTPPQGNASTQPPSGATYQQPPRANQDPSGTDLRNDA